MLEAKAFLIPSIAGGLFPTKVHIKRESAYADSHISTSILQRLHNQLHLYLPALYAFFLLQLSLQLRGEL